MDTEAKAQFLWQHEHGSRWISYNEKQLEAINKAYAKKQKTVTLPGKSEKAELIINLEQMYQRNKVTGWEQRIRCCVYDKSFYVWQWKDQDVWYSYIPGISLDLESAYKRNKELKFYFKDDYVCCTKTMEQRNENTGTVREIERQEIKVDMVPYLRSIAEAFTKALNNKIETDNADEDDDTSPKKKKIKLQPKEDETKCSKPIVPVDPVCSELVNTAHVYSDETGIYDAMLNQTELQLNSNKFFRLQLLKHNLQTKYYVWFHWGRVGKKGQNNLKAFHSALDSAKKEFTAKFYSKTKNNWDDRDDFQKHPGKYELLKMDYVSNKSSNEEKLVKKELPAPKPKIQLHPMIMTLLQMISDVDEMKKKVVMMKFDVNKTPLGKLNVEQIKAGYSALKKIESLLSNCESGSKLIQACNDFYTKIPHDFGMKTPPAITSIDMIKEKLELLEALSDIELNLQLQAEGIMTDDPIGYLYKKLQCEMKVLNEADEMHHVIVSYLHNTHGETHNLYTMEVRCIFECKKSNEHTQFIDYGNKYLLWHGSRLSNFIGILKNGLKIAPPEAPATGYMFGKGVYFADISSKSANYCYPTRQKNGGLLVLCEVSLGEQNILYGADYNAGTKTKGKNKHSVKAIGKFIPDPKEVLKIDEVTIPYGKPVLNEDQSPQLCLNYNEYIVYDTRQIKIRYLVHIDFKFK